MAALLLVAAILLLSKRVWGNLLAAVFSGYLPIQFFYEFWTFAKSADVPVLSYSHFSHFFSGIVEISGTVIFFFALTTMILSCSIYSILRLTPSRPANAIQQSDRDALTMT